MEKMVAIAAIAIGLVVALLLPILGGLGLTIGVFSGLKSIPSFVWITAIIIIILSIFRRVKK